MQVKGGRQSPQYPGVSAGPRLMLCYGPAMSAVETARLLLRRWQDADLEPLVTLFADPRWRDS